MAKVTGISIFQKTSLLAIILFGVISILTSALTAYTLYERMTSEYLSKGTAIAESIAGASQEVMLNRDVARIQAMIDQYLEIEGVAYVFVVDGLDEVVAHTFVPEMPKPLEGLVESKEATRVVELNIKPYGRIIDICKPVLAGVAGAVHVGMDKELILQYFWKVIIEMQVLMLAILIVCVAVLYFVTGRISMPLAKLAVYADRIAHHDFSARLEVTSRDEVGVLGRAMVSMAEELAALFANMESEVERAAGDLREHMVYLAAIIENLADGLLVVSPHGTITTINPVIREMFDLEEDTDYSGMRTDEVFPSEIFELAQATSRCGAEVQSAEIPLSRARVGKAVGSPISVDDPAPLCLGGVLLIRDITREKELDQLKTDFISTVSHELRTPMTSVLGFAKIIKKKLNKVVFPALEKDSELERPVAQVRENMEIIVSEAERLTELINDVLDIAKMEAGEVQWRDQVIFMADVIRQSVDSTRGLWKRKGIEVLTDVEDGLLPVRGDRSRLVQVMVNLISNAIKFTEESPVVCRAVMDGRNVLVSVSDKGMGIPEKAIGEIFDKFKQVGDTLTDKPTGTGLGLPISKQIIDYHLGEIWVESDVGAGSVFYFSIPAAQIRTSDIPEESECQSIMPKPDSTMLVSQVDEASDPLVLIVDDDPILTRYLTQVFESESFAVEVAANGEDAVKFASEHMPNLIIMDLMMPGMDGRTAIKCLRNNPFTRHIPILVLSALADGIAAGGDIALTKPVDDVRLREVTHSLLLEKDVQRACMVLGDKKDVNVENLSAVDPENVTFCSPEELWAHVEKGFKGTIFIPAEIGDVIDVELMTRLPDVAVVILPTLGGKG